MENKYYLDFEKVRNNAGMRVVPIFPLSELAKCINDDILKDPMTLKHKRSKAFEEYIPMTNLTVVAWLKNLVFKSNPHVKFKMYLLPCGTLIEDGPNNDSKD